MSIWHGYNAGSPEDEFQLWVLQLWDPKPYMGTQFSTRAAPFVYDALMRLRLGGCTCVLYTYLKIVVKPGQWFYEQISALVCELISACCERVDGFVKVKVIMPEKSRSKNKKILVFLFWSIPQQILTHPTTNKIFFHHSSLVYVKKEPFFIIKDFKNNLTVFRIKDTPQNFLKTPMSIFRES